MKKVFYILAGIVVLIIMGALIFYKIKHNTVEKPLVSKVIVPVAKSKKDRTEKNENDMEERQSQKNALLSENEMLLASLEIDLNLDGFDDRILAIFRMNENSIYLVPMIQDPLIKNYKQAEAVKVDAIQKTGFTLSSLDLGLDEKSAIVCSGVSQDNSQLLTIFLPDEREDGKNKIFTLKQIAFFRADFQISIHKNALKKSSGLASYTVSCFDADPSLANTLSQIEKIHRWSEKSASFEKQEEKLIPGEKIESNLLRKIGTGDIKLFREFLQGLWMQENDATSKKLFYFNDSTNEITFSDGELQEIYVISSFRQRAYSLHFTTYNKSLTNIILQVNLQIKSVNELRINVTEQVTRLKIGAESLWNGIYKKKDENTTTGFTVKNVSQAEKLLKQKSVVWKNDSFELKLAENNFVLKKDNSISQGSFTVFKFDDNIILQLKSDNNRTFYQVRNYKNDLVLLEVRLKLDKVEALDNTKIILKAEKEK